IDETVKYRSSSGGNISPSRGGFINVAGNNTFTNAVVIEPFSNSAGDRQNYFVSLAGNLNLQGGILKSSAFTNISDLTFGGAGNFTVGSIDANGQTGSWNVRKIGAGTARFNGTNSYNGNTHVFEGTLLVNGTTANNNNETIAYAGDVAISSGFS